MRIKSDFKDYYDGLLRNDEDRETLYLRRTLSYKIKEKHLIPSFYPDTCIYSPTSFFTSQSFTFGFCGKIYGAFQLTGRFRQETRSVMAFSAAEVRNFVAGFGNKTLDEFDMAGYGRRAHWCSCHAAFQFRSYFDRIAKSREAFGFVFDKYSAPAWVYYDGTLVINPRLARYNFQKIFPPYQAYQELRMWLSNLAHPNKPIPAISNEDMIEAKGFDLKTSFRKTKSKDV